MSHGTEHVTPFQLLLLALSIFVLASMAVEVAFRLPPDVSAILEQIDNLICAVFFIDFAYRLHGAPRKWEFLRWGWVDLVSSIPTIDAFRWGRLVRIIRVLRLLRGIRSVRAIYRILFANRAAGTAASTCFACLLLVVFASIAILHVETEPDSNITTAGDALWWAFATITTVGYGDRYPTSAEGRFIAGLLMAAGVGVFGVFTGVLTSWFMGPESTKETTPVEEQMAALRAEICALRTQLSEVNTAREQHAAAGEV